MPARTKPPRDPVPPTISPQKGIELLRVQIARTDEIMALPHNDSRIQAWNSTTINIHNQTFGKADGEMSDQAKAFTATDSKSVAYIGMNGAYIQKLHVERYQARKVLLEAFVEQLQILAPPAAVTAPDQYRFHPEIEGVSGALYRNGHYRDAALTAYIRVIEAVRERSGVAEDGDSLMGQVFAFQHKAPVLAFNDLQTQAEQDEQQGLFYLYKGIVGLRNSKAHSVRVFDDPQRAHEYLALASLLMRLLEIAIDWDPSRTIPK